MHDLIENGTMWTLKEVGTDSEQIRQNETLFSLSNGHIGTRGSLEERHRTQAYSHSGSTLMNGFYDTEPITYGEWAYGYATHHQTTIPVPDAKKMDLSLGDEQFDLETGKVDHHSRTLDLKKGLLTRTFSWENSRQQSIDVTIERFVSYDFPELLAQRITIGSEADDLQVQLTFELDELEDMGKEESAEDDPDPRKKEQAERRFDSESIATDSGRMIHISTHASDLHAVIYDHVESQSELVSLERVENKVTASFQTDKSAPVVIDRFTAYSHKYSNEEDTDTHAEHLKKIMSEVEMLGYDEVKDRHISFMDDFWKLSDIELEGDQALQIGLRFNLFHLHQAAGRDGHTNMSAKGLTGEGYEGHYFWDTEMYMFPFFLYTQPEIAKSLLMYRHSILPQARERARTMAIENGALFAWRTINGEEASPYYPAGTAQIHINADIAHAVYDYGKVSEDESFMFNEGLDILVETARFWLEWGHFDDERKGAFVLNDVTGPDEYTAIVNNNFYTNLMAKKNLSYAIEYVQKALKQATDKLDELHVTEDELENWKQAESRMFLPYDEEKELTMQDDSFFHKKVWDFEHTPKDNYPLLLNYHPLTIYKHQVCKQADTVLAEFLFFDDFKMEQLKRDYDYYEKVTTHDSSLSRSVFGMMASQIGKHEKAYDYFMDTALMDISDLQSNTKDGVHAANMGGTWMSIVQGFAGMRFNDGTLYFTPHCPEEWSRLSFKVQVKNRLIQVTLTPSSTEYTLLEGKSITIVENGEQIRL